MMDPNFKLTLVKDNNNNNNIKDNNNNHTTTLNNDEVSSRLSDISVSDGDVN